MAVVWNFKEMVQCVGKSKGDRATLSNAVDTLKGQAQHRQVHKRVVGRRHS